MSSDPLTRARALVAALMLAGKIDLTASASSGIQRLGPPA